MIFQETFYNEYKNRLMNLPSKVASNQSKIDVENCLFCNNELVGVDNWYVLSDGSLVHRSIYRWLASTKQKNTKIKLTLEIVVGQAIECLISNITFMYLWEQTLKDRRVRRCSWWNRCLISSGNLAYISSINTEHLMQTKIWPLLMMGSL